MVNEWIHSRSGRRVRVFAGWPTIDWSAIGSERYFGLLLVADHAISIGSAAAVLLERGLAFVSAWGTDCARTEADFDSAIVDRNPNETADDVILTTSHANDSVDEAVEFFVVSAHPASAYFDECNTWDIVATSSPLLAAVERALVSCGATRRNRPGRRWSE